MQTKKLNTLNTYFKTHCTVLLILTLLLASTGVARGQFADCSTGLLQMPTAEMQPDGTFMITNNFLNKHSLSSGGWGYSTFQYGVSISLWGRVEIGYVCTLFDGKRKPTPSERDMITFNQDRHFVGRICLLQEGDFGLDWMPSLTIGVSDPTTGSGGDYTNPDSILTSVNGFFNRYYVVSSKHFTTNWGVVGAHIGYQFNRRFDYRINAPCIGVNWQPIWLQQKGLLDNLSVIAEYDSRTVNLGMIASLWKNRFEAMFELQNLQWINFGLRYKLQLKKVA